jgi:superfamily II DNA or RNA helicase
MSFATGTLVKARGREWVVLPGSTDDLLLVHPLGGADAEDTGILSALEEIQPATFDPPDPDHVGDARSARLLRDALRLGFRSSAGPFRSFGQIAVQPRPYQLVPLLMALKLDPIRLLIADDVGIGKTIEASLIAKEALAQGDTERLAVLCPPHLAEQWQKELNDKFHIDAQLVLPSTVGRLERGLSPGASLFEHYPFVVVSIDFIKSDRYRAEFIRTCPEFVIVDEAHGATLGAERARQQRHALVSGLAKDAERHLVLVTATPHSGKEEAFRSLLALVDPELGDLPEDLRGRENETNRRRLARHLVQRRRADIRHYLATDTAFPDRHEREETYSLSAEYRRLFDRVLMYARETVRDPEGGQRRQRVRWWSALALLRSLASSPAAAAETLRNRAASADAETEDEIDEIGRRTVLDTTDEETMEGLDVAPGADAEPEGDDDQRRDRRRLLEMAREADKLKGELDNKLQGAIQLVKGLLKDGFSPIVFCRFIPTAEYVADAFRSSLKGVEVEAITGKLPPAERELRVAALGEASKRVLVATDCLSEGINLQDHFDAVMHYDLSWNPTRHEQREGRVDRFGQKADVVRALTYYGVDNQIDGIVLEVLIRKSKAIRDRLGVSVPVPEDTDSVLEAIFEGLLLREQAGGIAERLPGFEEFFRPRREDFHKEWEDAADREERSRTLFQQETLDPDEVARELRETQRAVGGTADVERFVLTSLTGLGAIVTGDDPKHIDLNGTPQSLRDALGRDGETDVTFSPSIEGEYVTRTSPLVEGLATHVLDTSLDDDADGIASRCGVIRANTVTKRTTVLLARFRFDIATKRGGTTTPQLAEDAAVLAFEGAPEAAVWLSEGDAERLLSAEPTGNVPEAQATDLVRAVVEGIERLRPHLDDEAKRRADELQDAHERVRKAARVTTTSTVEPKLPVDILGIYVYLPTPGAS